MNISDSLLFGGELPNCCDREPKVYASKMETMCVECQRERGIKSMHEQQKELLLHGAIGRMSNFRMHDDDSFDVEVEMYDDLQAEFEVEQPKNRLRPVDPQSRIRPIDPHMMTEDECRKLYSRSFCKTSAFS